MSAIWLMFIPALSFCCMALTAAGKEGVIWKHTGEQITIQCKSSAEQEYLYLKRGLNEDEELFVTVKNSQKSTVHEKFKDRLQSHGNFPNVDILIKNLNQSDSGPYWCVYRMMDENLSLRTTKGEGSVLLVVSEKRPIKGEKEDARQCNPQSDDLVLVSVVIVAAVLIVILMVFLIGIIIKTRSLRTTGKKRRVPTNDIYEDMRGTIRR